MYTNKNPREIAHEFNKIHNSEHNKMINIYIIYFYVTLTG